MTRSLGPLPSPFTAPERELLRRELCRHFGQDPRVADGIYLRTWRSGPQKGEPKLPPAIQSMRARGLVEIRTAQFGWHAFFTEPGLAASYARNWVVGRRRRIEAGDEPA